MKRTSWSLMHLEWDLLQWSRVLRSDETTFYGRLIKQRMSCVRRKNERHQLKCTSRLLSQKEFQFMSGKRSITILRQILRFLREYLITKNTKSFWMIMSLHLLIMCGEVSETLFCRRTIVASIEHLQSSRT